MSISNNFRFGLILADKFHNSLFIFIELTAVENGKTATKANTNIAHVAETERDIIGILQWNYKRKKNKETQRTQIWIQNLNCAYFCGFYLFIYRVFVNSVYADWYYGLCSGFLSFAFRSYLVCLICLLWRFAICIFDMKSVCIAQAPSIKLRNHEKLIVWSKAIGFQYSHSYAAKNRNKAEPKTITKEFQFRIIFILK